MFKNFKRLQTTKKLLRLCYILVSCVTLSDIAYAFYSNDGAVLSTLTDKSFEAFMVCVSFYIWKAKNENMKKYNKCIIEESEE